MIFGIDIDETLTKESCWTREQVLSATLNKKVADTVNKLYFLGHTIILYTCRGDSVIPATRCWLKENHVKYHALNNNKLWCDYFIDDKAVSPDNFTKYEKKFLQMVREEKHRGTKTKGF